MNCKAKPPKPKAAPFALFNNLNSSVVVKTEYFINPIAYRGGGAFWPAPSDCQP